MATILVVDDEQVILDVLSERLLKHGHSVIGASDGREALEICHEQAGCIQLVITGIYMPGMNGVELGKQLETHYPHLKVIYMSGYPPSRKMLKEDSVFLEKPFTEEVLILAVNTALRRGIRVLMSTGGEDAITKVFTLLLQNRLGTRYDFQVREIPYATKFLEYAETQPVDLFVIVLNNIITDAQALFPDTFRFDQVVQIISCLKKKYRKPVIALAGGWPKENKSYIAEVIEAGADQFFGLPPDPDAFIEAVRKCLESPESTI